MTNALRRASVIGGLLALFSIPFLVSAADFRLGEETVVRGEETFTDDLYLAGGAVTVSGNVTGDVTVMGGNVLLNGPVSADVIATGGSLTLLGAIGGDVRAFGGNTIVQSDIGGDLILAGGQATLSGPRIGGDAVVGAGSIRVDTPIEGDAFFAGSNVHINAPIAGSVIVKSEQVTFGPNGRVGGNFTYSATKPIEVASTTVAGTTTYEPQPDVRSAAKAGLSAFLSLWIVAKFLMILAGALFFGLFFISYSTKLVYMTAEAPLSAVGRGVIFIIVLPILSILLLTSVIGMPIGLLGLIGYVGALVVVWLLAPIVAGSLLYRWWTSSEKYEVSWKTILLGVAAVFLAGFVPILGVFAKLALYLVTLGAVLKFKWEVAKEWR